MTCALGKYCEVNCYGTTNTCRNILINGSLASTLYINGTSKTESSLQVIRRSTVYTPINGTSYIYGTGKMAWEDATVNLGKNSYNYTKITKIPKFEVIIGYQKGFKFNEIYI